MYSVFVEGLEFYGFHGVSDAEREVGHRFALDLEVEVDGKADQTDAVADTADYSQIAATALAQSDQRNFATVEGLAGAMAAALLDVFPKVRSVSVRLAKLLPPMAASAERVGVEVSRRR